MLLNFILILITNLINNNTMIDISFVFMSILIFLIRFFIDGYVMMIMEFIFMFIFIKDSIVNIVLLSINYEIFEMLIYKINVWIYLCLIVNNLIMR